MAIKVYIDHLLGNNPISNEALYTRKVYWDHDFNWLGFR